MITIRERIKPLIIKGIAVSSRYIFLLIFGKLLNITDFANFNLLTSLITFVLYFIGIDYYVYLHRSYHDNNGTFFQYLGKYLIVMLVTALIGIIPLWYFLLQLNIPWFLMVLVCFIPVTELLLQEAYRFQILKGKQSSANMMLFVRYLWMVPCLLIVYFFKSAIPFATIICTWVTLNGLYCFYLVFYYYNFFDKYKNFDIKNIRDLLTDLKALAPIFLATISLRAFFFLDKWIPQLLGFEAKHIANYAFNSLFGAAVTTIFDAILISHFYPVIMASKNKSNNEFSGVLFKFSKEMLLVSLLITILTAAICPFIGFKWGSIDITGSVVFWSVFCQIVYNIALVPHYALFALKKDRSVLISNFAGLVVFVSTLLSFLIFLQPSVELIFWAISLGFITIFVFKLFYLKKHGYTIY